MAAISGGTAKPLNVGDFVTISGKITSFGSGDGHTATVNVTTTYSGSSIVIQSKDITAHTQTK